MRLAVFATSLLATLLTVSPVAAHHKPGHGGLAVAPVALLAERIGLSAATAMVASTGLVGALAMRLIPAVPGRERAIVARQDQA